MTETTVLMGVNSLRVLLRQLQTSKVCSFVRWKNRRRFIQLWLIEQKSRQMAKSALFKNLRAISLYEGRYSMERE